jgi:hypothetical protein
MAKNISREIGGEMNSINNLLIKLLESNDKTRQSIDALAFGGISQKGKTTKSLDLQKQIVEDNKEDRENSKKDIVEARKAVSDLEQKLSLNIAAKGNNILDVVQGFVEKQNPVLGNLIGGVSGLFKIQEGISKLQKTRAEDKEKLADARQELKDLGVEEDKRNNQYKLYNLIEGFEKKYFGIKKEEIEANKESEIIREKEAIQAREAADEALDAAGKGSTSVKVTPEEKKKEQGEGILDSILPTAIGTAVGGGFMTAVISALPWMLIAGGVAMAIGDAFAGITKAGEWGTDKISAGLGGFLGGTGSGIAGAFANMGKWALAGAGIGAIMGVGIFSIPGAILGGLIGAAIGGILGFIGGEKIAKGLNWVGKLIGKLWAGYTGRLSEGWNFGMSIGGPVGGIAAALIWGSFGGIIDWIGKSTGMDKVFGGLMSNVSGFFTSGGGKHFGDGWKLGYNIGGPVGGIIGAVLGGAFGGIIDWMSSGGMSGMIDKIAEWLKSLFPDWGFLIDKVRGGAKALVSPAEDAAAKVQELASSQMGAQILQQGVGAVSEHFESGGRGTGTISSGAGDAGGVSYGKHQLSSKAGTLNTYLKSSGYDKQFAGLAPGSEGFNTKWKSLASSDQNFGQSQTDFIGKTHAQPQLAKLKALGVDTSNRAIQEMAFSTGTQYGGGHDVMVNAIKSSGKDPKKMTPEEIISTVQDYKSANVKRNFVSSSESVQKGVTNRISSEKAMLLSVQRESPKKGTTETTATVTTPTKSVTSTPTPTLGSSVVTSSGVVVPASTSETVAAPSEPELSTSVVTKAGEVVPSQPTSLVTGTSGVIPVYVTNINATPVAVSSGDVVVKKDDSGATVSSDTKAVEVAQSASTSAPSSGGSSGSNTFINAPSIAGGTPTTSGGNPAANDNTDIYKAIVHAGTYMDYLQTRYA